MQNNTVYGRRRGPHRIQGEGAVGERYKGVCVLVKGVIGETTNFDNTFLELSGECAIVKFLIPYNSTCLKRVMVL